MMDKSGVLVPDEYFLSATNPIATVDQRHLEALAIHLMKIPVVIKAGATVAARWKTIVGLNMTATEALMHFDELAEEWAFNYVLKAVNSDPKVLSNLWGAPHEWFGMKVPGSRGSGGDRPDTRYTIIPIDDQARYELSGWSFDTAVGDALSFWLATSRWEIMSSYTSRKCIWNPCGHGTA